MPKSTVNKTIVNNIEYSLINGEACVVGVLDKNDNGAKVTNLEIVSSVTFPNNIKVPVTSIADSAFASCSPPSFISIPSSVKKIGLKAFAVLYLEPEDIDHKDSKYNPKPELELKIPAEFASFTYFNMSKVRKITIISGDKIEDQAFKYATRLTTVIFENDSSSPLISIGAAAFKDCIFLKNIILPDTVTNIGANAFSYCTNLKSITIPSGVTNIKQGTFYKCVTLESILIQPQSSMEYIGGNAFAYCTALNSFIIPDSVTTINAKAFYNCRSLTNISIPLNVTKIGDQAFFACAKLKEVTFKETDYLPSIGKQAFENNAKDNTANYYISVQNEDPPGLLHEHAGFKHVNPI